MTSLENISITTTEEDMKITQELQKVVSDLEAALIRLKKLGANLASVPDEDTILQKVEEPNV